MEHHLSVTQTQEKSYLTERTEVRVGTYGTLLVVECIGIIWWIDPKTREYGELHNSPRGVHKAIVWGYQVKR